MNNYHFQFQKSYSGNWTFSNSNANLPGTLYLDDQGIKLDLMFSTKESRPDYSINEVNGIVEAELNGQNTIYHIKAWGLSLIHLSVSSCFYHLKLAVDHILFYSDVVDTTNIKSMLFRSPLFDKWLQDINNERIIDNQLDLLVKDNGNPNYQLELIPTKSITLYASEKEEYIVHLMFGINHNLASINITTYCFLRWRHKDSSEDIDAIIQRDKIIGLFSLLWNNFFSPDFVQYDTNKGNFIYKESNRYSRHYNSESDATITSDFSDFDIEDFKRVIETWNSFYEKYPYAMGLYYNVLQNNFMPHESRIKDLVDVIDGITKNIEVDESDVNHEWDSIIDKIENSHSLDEDEFGKLKKMLVSVPFLKRRMSSLVTIVEKYLPDLDPEFSVKSVNTRNHLTHVKDKRGPIYERAQYGQLADALIQVINTYILHCMGLKKELIMKIVCWTIMKNPNPESK